MSHRIAISRIEALIAVIIVGLVASLFMAWTARLRNQAKATSCQNNLKQIGLALQNYHDSNEKLPALVDQGAGGELNKSVPSVFAWLTPFIEADPRWYSPTRIPPNAYYGHSSVPFTYSNKDGTIGIDYGGIANRTRKVFIDPSDESARPLRDIAMTLPEGETGYYATGCYAANGMAPWGISRFTDSFPKGTSNIILFGERPQVCQSPNGESTYNLWGLGFYSPHMPAFAAQTPNDPPGTFSTNQVAPVLPLPNEGLQYQVRIGRMDAEPELPDFTNPIQLIRPGRPCDPRLPGTPHRGGMQVVMADGSVRVFSLTTSSLIFWSACAPTEQ
jgi:prepilin-type processing-associated H-X9-DG protein